MEDLASNPAFRTYALCAGILGLKMLASAFYTGLQRQRHSGFINAEDARAFGAEDAQASAEEAPEVAHALRIQRNDLENIPLFLILGLIYVLAGATTTGASAYFWTFTVARVAHSLFYTLHLQPWRAGCYLLSTACTLGVIAHIVAF